MLSGNWSATVSHNQDFMLCRKEGVVVAPDDRGEFTLGGISFTRQCALLQLAVTANDFTNNTVQQCAATVSNLNSNSITWNAGQTALSTGGTGGAVNFSWSSLNAATVNSNVYKVLPQSSRTLTIKLTTLRIGNIQYNNRVTVNASGRQFAAGGNYKITVKITGNGITVGGATWAKGNVYKSGSNFYFESSQSGYHSGTQGGSFSAGILSLPLITRMEEAPFLPIMILAIKLLPNTHGVLRLPTSYKIWEIVDIGLDIWMVRGEDILAVIRFFCPQWETEVRIM